jgi:hypothetical protein
MNKHIYSSKMGKVFRDEHNEPRWNQLFTADQVAALAGYSVPEDKDEKPRFLKRIRKAISRYRRNHQEILELCEPWGEIIGRLPMFIYANIGGVYRYGYTQNALAAYHCEKRRLNWEIGSLAAGEYAFNTITKLAETNPSFKVLACRISTIRKETRESLFRQLVNLGRIKKALDESVGQVTSD